MRIRGVLWSLMVIVVVAVAAPTLAGFAAKEVYLPSVGIGKGAGTSYWYTTLWVHNPGTSPVNVQFQFLERDKSNPSPTYVYNETIQAGDTKRYGNAMEAIFGIADRRFGAIRVMAGEDVVVNGRIYSKVENGEDDESVGQFFAGVPSTFAIGPGEKTTLLGVYQTSPQEESEYRYNFGFVEVAGGTPLVQVQVRDDSGDLRTTQAYALRPYEPKQYNIRDLMPGIDLTNAILEVTVLSNSTGKVVVFGSGLANSSNDSSTFEMTFKGDLLAS